MIGRFALESNLTNFNAPVLGKMKHRRVPTVFALAGSQELVASAKDVPFEKIDALFLDDVLPRPAFHGKLRSAFRHTQTPARRRLPVRSLSASILIWKVRFSDGR
jgi:hypothetical protein